MIPPAPPQSLNIFFLGHSLQNFDIPAMVDGIADSLGDAATWAAKIGLGASLSWQYNNPNSGTGFPTESFNTNTHLTSTPYDVVVITEAQPLSDQITWNSSAVYAGNFFDFAVGANANCQVYLYEHWSSSDIAGWAAWRAQIDTDLPSWESIRGTVNNARSPANPMLLIPGGQAMAALYDALQANALAGYSAITDFFADDIHLNDTGNYYIALVQYAQIYGKSPIGATSTMLDRYAGAFDNIVNAAGLQQLAHDVVGTYNLWW